MTNPPKEDFAEPQEITKLRADGTGPPGAGVPKTIKRARIGRLDAEPLPLEQ